MEDLQAVEWWEKAAEEALEMGVDPAQALRFFMKAEAAAQALQGRMQAHVADSALSLGPLLAGSRAAGSFNKTSRYADLTSTASWATESGLFQCC